MKKGSVLGFFNLVLIFVIFASNVVQAQQEYTPSELRLTVYTDGIVRVEYNVELDITSPVVEISVFGSVYEDMIIEDQDGIPLDYALSTDGIEVYSLGTSSARIMYFTSDLTSKSARTWVLTLVTPINSYILLPLEATIISLNQVPITISNLDGQTLLIMPAGEQTITYIIGVVRTKDQALVLINEVETKIDEMKAANIVVTEVEDTLQEAIDAFNREQYAEAEQLVRQAKERALQIEATALEAGTRIREAESSIIKAQQENRLRGLEEAQETLQQAENKYTDGKYEEAIDFAEQAEMKAEKAEEQAESKTEKVETPPRTSNVWILSLVPIFIIIVVLFFKFKKKHKVEKAVNVEEIFKRHPQLRYSDREVIQFLAERGGESLETDIRERFRLPRTTAWRLVKRLQREGVIEIQKVGEQNLIRIKKQYQE